MKKLIYLVSAIITAVGISSVAKADVAVSGAGTIGFVSDPNSADNTHADSTIYTGASVAFDLSTTTDNGVGISASLGISNDTGTGSAASASGGTSIGFTVGGASITVGNIDVAGAGTGGVGSVVSDLVGNNDMSGSASADLTGDSGAGIAISTAMGGASVDISWLSDGATTGDVILNGDTDSTGISVSLPMGDLAVTLGYASWSDAASSGTNTGGEVAYDISGGTLTVGYGSRALEGGNATSMGATFETTLSDATSIAVGYNSTKGNDDTSNVTTEVAISQSLGGGASVFLEASSLSGDGDTGTAFAIGSSISF